MGVSVLLVAISVWLQQTKNNWEKELEKRLTVHFEFEGKEIMRCEEAYLAGDDDIRNWGQQIGKQMANNAWLKFEPYLEEEHIGVKYDEEEKVNYNLYELTIYLTEKPAQIDLTDDLMKTYQYTKQFTDEHGVLVWKNIKNKKEKVAASAPSKSTPETAETET